jgi:ketosteroid isomerase-like protein
MDARQIGEQLVELCRQGRNFEAIDALYGDEIVSIEAVDNPNFAAEVRGLDAVKQKNTWWFDNNEVHSAAVEGPFAHNDRFAVKYHFDFTRKSEPMLGQRVEFDEVAVYTVQNGKIVREEFYYNA